MKKFFIIFAPLIAGALLLTPTSVLAGGSVAGIPKDLIWFSSDTFFEGDQVSVFTTLYNSTPDQFSGKATLYDGILTIGTKDFSVSPNGASTVLSFPWKATKGEHAFSVKVNSGEFATGARKFSDILGGETSTAKVNRSVLAKKVVPVTPPVVSSTTTGVQNEDDNQTTNPIKLIKENGIPVLGAIEAFRQAQTNANTDRIANIKSSLEGEGLPTDLFDVALLPTSKAGFNQLFVGKSGTDILTTPWEYVKLFFLYCYQFVVSHPYLFYILALLIVYKLIRAVLGLIA